MRATLLLFSLTLFLSAALMFGLQPMIGKMLLPLVGGTPSGWIVAMAFFQIMLLAGYFVAYALSRFEPRKQAVLYLICLAIGIFFLPVSLAKHADLLSATPMAFDVMLLLTVAVAVPFVALSATASTIQRLFTTTGHSSAKDPYFLYAASNLGSFAGLLLYPFLIEPRLTLTAQSYNWLVGYILLISMAAICLLMSGKKASSDKPLAKTSVSVGWKKRLEWICLSFLPSGLLLAVTTHVTTDIFSAPLLWVLPLSLYLLTFVVAFSKRPIVSYNWILKIQPVAVSITLALTLLVSQPLALSWFTLAINLVSFTIVALMCHMRLARTRPSDSHLTEFYLMIAVGGALGGILNAFIAPVIFDRLVEYPLIMVASSLLNENIRQKVLSRHIRVFIAGCVLTCILALLYSRGMMNDSLQNIFMIVIFVLLTLHPRMLVAGGALAFIAISSYLWLNPPLLTERNFYGVIKVYDKKVPLVPGEEVNIRYMRHGTTLHGYQIMDEKYELTPTVYYTREGPLNDALTLIKPKNIAAIGLGTGTINCFATPQRKITFFEIDPAVVKMAKEQFTYLSKCGTGTPRILVGDARLELKKLDEKFDLIILDAFSSDTIPTHLLTKEAIELYLQRLTPNGSILLHISNRYFKLDAPIAAAGNALGLKNAVMWHKDLKQPYASKSKWMILAPEGVNLAPLIKDGRATITEPDDTKPWTDDYTDLLSTFNF